MPASSADGGSPAPHQLHQQAAALHGIPLGTWAQQGAQTQLGLAPQLMAQLIGDWTQQAAQVQTSELAAQMVKIWAQQAQAAAAQV